MGFSGSDIRRREQQQAMKADGHISAPLLTQHLLPGEHLIMTAERDRFEAWVSVSFWVVLAGLAFYFGFLTAGLWLGVAAMAAYVWTDFKCKQLQIGLTDRRVLATQWVNMRRETADMPLERIESVIVEEAADGSYGTLRISGTGSVVLRFEHIRRPSLFRQKIDEQLAALGRS